jgi:hypothetical protein
MAAVHPCPSPLIERDAMRMPALWTMICLLVMAGCDAKPSSPPASNTPGTPSAPTAVLPPVAAAGAQTPEQFIAAYRAAHASKNVDEELKLVCWDDVAADRREIIRENVLDESQSELNTVEMVAAPSKPDKWQEGNLWWRANLKPTHVMKLTFKTAPGGGLQMSAAEKNVGLKNGRYLFVVNVPAQ